ncbi:MAG: Gfo/Idh/MocA family oxidoreductase, partial [Clostridia bacterium]|nr:Gfo/Idh/MocA family oxidoreductase [Clostridia bacterium]
MVGVIHGLGIIGFGGVARIHYDRLLQHRYKRFSVKGIFDISPTACEAGEKRGLRVYSSLDEILADEAIECVLIATTNDAHAPLSIAAMRAGKNVICEKPVTMSSAELTEVMAVAKETGKVFTIDQNRRVNPDFVPVGSCMTDGRACLFWCAASFSGCSIPSSKSTGCGKTGT